MHKSRGLLCIYFCRSTKMEFRAGTSCGTIRNSVRGVWYENDTFCLYREYLPQSYGGGLYAGPSGNGGTWLCV